MHDLASPSRHEDAVGIVLAGGRSRRLAPSGLGPGGKAAIIIAGESLLGRICRVVGGVVSRVIVVAAQGQPLPGLPARVEVVRDSTPEAGPTAGLCDGLRQARDVDQQGVSPRVAFVTSCDAPLLSTAVVRLLLEIAREPGVRLVVPIVGGHPQVLVSAVALDLVEMIAAEAAAGNGLRAMIGRLQESQPSAVRLVASGDVVQVDPDLESFFDIDTPEDLARLHARGIPSSRG
ncbi:MAG: molybdenum cofactor guanylyltransferase [Pirellulales bacterium]